jgi:hypothetical protein
MLNITAHIIAFPKPEIYWQFGQNGLCINVSSGITNSFNIKRHSSSLVKRNVAETDFGMYRLYAYNSVGSTQYLLHSFVVLPEGRYIFHFIFIFSVYNCDTDELTFKTSQSPNCHFD